jgi:uncharacterized delta-60 repeat protein
MVVTTYTGPAPADALLQPDGKIIVVTGFDTDPNATETFGLLRYQSNGTPDTSFGVAGRASAAFTTFISTAHDAVLQPDGKIVVVGETESADGTLSEFAVARFTTNGSLDSTFGTGGKVTTNLVGVQAGGVRNPATSVLLQTDGKILVGGSASLCPRARCGGTKTALVRYTANGSLDSTFGTGGTVSVLDITAPSSLAQDAAGDIFAVNGSLSTEFSAAGALLSQVTPAALTATSSAGFQVNPTLFQPDGKFLVAKSVVNGSTGYQHDIDTQVVRLQTNGTADPSFVNPPFDFGTDLPNSAGVAQTLARQPDGQVIAAGLRSAGGNNAFTVARLTAAGSLDTTFGTAGTATANLPLGGQASVALVQPDGKILVIGQGFTNTGVNLVLVRYLGH